MLIKDTERDGKVKGLIEELAKDPDVINAVKDIEGRIMTTKYHYGDYMAFLSPFTKQVGALYIMSQALILAGADYEGVQWAVRLLKGEGH